MDFTSKPDMFEYHDEEMESNISPQGKQSTEQENSKSIKESWTRNMYQNETERSLSGNCVRSNKSKITPIKHLSMLKPKNGPKDVKHMKDIQEQLIRQNRILYEDPIKKMNRPKIFDQRNYGSSNSKSKNCLYYL